MNERYIPPAAARKKKKRSSVRRIPAMLLEEKLPVPALPFSLEEESIIAALRKNRALYAV